MELLDTNIAATIVYPPDMPTPGFEEENKTKVCFFTLYIYIHRYYSLQLQEL